MGFPEPWLCFLRNHKVFQCIFLGFLCRKCSPLANQEGINQRNSLLRWDVGGGTLCQRLGPSTSWGRTGLTKEEEDGWGGRIISDFTRLSGKHQREGEEEEEVAILHPPALSSPGFSAAAGAVTLHQHFQAF